MTPQQRADIANAIWLCQTCAKLVDNDPARFDTALLLSWKSAVEKEALAQIGKTAASNRPRGLQVVDKWVTLSYPEDIGLSARLRTAGYDLYWSAANNEAERVDLQGWEAVLVEQPDGSQARLKIHDHPIVGGYLVLLKRKHR